MSDSFNPHEILSRLRAKPVGIHVNNNPNNHSINSSNHLQNNNFISSNNNTVYPIPGSPNVIPSSPMNIGSQNGPGSNSTISPTKALASSKTIKTPASLTLTPAQRQDNLAMRNELEKEVKRLQEEIHLLKLENKQLREDKTDVERQLIDFKLKHDDVVTKLRGKIAQLTFQQQKEKPHSTVSDSTGKLYPPHPTFPTTTKAPPSATKATVAAVPPLPSVDQGFREPTFSELMRRSTVTPPDFQESLRRNHHGQHPPPPPSTTNNNTAPHPEAHTSTSYGIDSHHHQQPSHHNNHNHNNNHQFVQPSPDPIYSAYNPPNMNMHLNHNNNHHHNTIPSTANPNTNNSAPTATNNPTTSTGTGHSKPMHRTLSFFDPSIMKGKNLLNHNTLTSNGGETTSGTNGHEPVTDYPVATIPASLQRNSGVGGHNNASMYSITNNYPGFASNANNTHANGSSNNNNHDYGGGETAAETRRKMSIPDTGFPNNTSNYYHNDHGAMPTVEIDLSL